MTADTRGIRERLKQIKERLSKVAEGAWYVGSDVIAQSRADVPWLIEQLEEALRKIERLENSIEVRQ